MQACVNPSFAFTPAGLTSKLSSTLQIKYRGLYISNVAYWFNLIMVNKT